MFVQQERQFRQWQVFGSKSALDRLIWWSLSNLSFDSFSEQWRILRNMFEGSVIYLSVPNHWDLPWLGLTCLLSDPTSSHRKSRSHRCAGYGLLWLLWRGRSEIASCLMNVGLTRDPTRSTSHSPRTSATQRILVAPDWITRPLFGRSA